MFGYILDSNVVNTCQRASCLQKLAAASAVVRMAMADDVRDELTLPPRLTDPVTAKMKEFAQALLASSIEVIEIPAESPEHDMRDALKRMVGAGEAASIAVALQRPDLIFVTEDIKAVEGEKLKLYRELPGEVGRIMGLHAFLRVLFDRGAITAQVATAISTAGVRSNGPPLWWAAWVAALPRDT